MQDSSHKSAAEKMTTKVVGRERGSEAAAADGGAPRKKRKAARADTRSDGVTAEQPAEHTSEAVAVGSDAVTKKRKSGRADVSAPGSEAKQPVATKAKKATAKLASGPSNAEEARQLRERLGAPLCFEPHGLAHLRLNAALHTRSGKADELIGKM